MRDDWLLTFLILFIMSAIVVAYLIKPADCIGHPNGLPRVGKDR